MFKGFLLPRDELERILGRCTDDTTVFHICDLIETEEAIEDVPWAIDLFSDGKWNGTSFRTITAAEARQLSREYKGDEVVVTEQSWYIIKFRENLLIVEEESPVLDGLRRYCAFSDPASRDAFLMIEPNEYNEPIVDSLTRKAAAMFNHHIRPEPGRHSFGVHTCSCGANSDSKEWTLTFEGKKYRTNSLAVHYVACHRREVPERELRLIESFPYGEEPTERQVWARSTGVVGATSAYRK